MGKRSALAGAVLVAGLLVSACSADAPAPTRTSGHLSTSWERVPFTGLTPVTLATDGPSLLVGAFSTDRPHARILAGTSAVTLHELPLTPRSPYAFEGRWFGIVARDGQIEAIAGARGGAHGNYRWTTWSGSATGVAEQEQPFGVFGSYGAGDLTGIAYAGRSPVILGAWQSDRTGLDIATWTRAGERWARQPSTDSPLGSTPEELLGAYAITTNGDGLVIGGSVTRLGPGSVRVDPALWTSPDQGGPWTRVDLPRSGSTSGSAVAEAHAATCTSGRCLIGGSSGGRFTFWELRGRTASQPPGAPDVEVASSATVLAPVTIGGSELFVVPQAGGSVVLRRAGQEWTMGEGPDGTPVSAVAHGDELWVVTTDAQEAGTLWHSRVT